MTSHKPLLVDVFELARDRGTLDGELPLATLPRLAASLLRASGVMRYRIRGEVDDRGRPCAAMQLDASLVLECQRCNQELDYPLLREARFRFVASEEELNALPIEEDEVDVIVGSRHMDLGAWIEDEAILSLPLVPRHDHCQPAVVRDAQAEAVDPGDRRPNPFAALASLKRGGKPN